MNLLVVANRNNPTTLDAFYQISAYADSQGIGHGELDISELPDASFPYSASAEEVRERYGGPYDLMITLGGDGTILRASRLAFCLGTPILGMNLGHLGFLANTVEKSVIALLTDALAGDILQENRMNLKIEVSCFGDGEEGLPNPRIFYALNEIAIARGALGHIVDFDFSISGDKIASMRGDGLIVATATGSTAYALAAGGPLVGPSHRGMITVPLNPHTLNTRSIVAEHHDVVEMRFEEGSASSQEVSLFSDGDALYPYRPIESVRVSIGEHPITLLTQRRESFYKQVSRTFFQG